MKKKCILIFDDDPDILLVCKIILEQNDFQVETRLTCDDVIKDIHLVQPDLVLMDLWIPKIGGEQAIRLMNGDECTRQVPVLIFSANENIETISKDLNADGFVKKPFDLGAFSKIISAHIPDN